MKNALKILVTVTLASILVVASVFAAKTPSLTSTVTVNFKTSSVGATIDAQLYHTMIDTDNKVGVAYQGKTHDGTSYKGNPADWSGLNLVFGDKTSYILSFKITNDGSRPIKVTFSPGTPDSTITVTTSVASPFTVSSATSQTLNVTVGLSLTNDIHDNSNVGDLNFTITMTTDTSGI